MSHLPSKCLLGGTQNNYNMANPVAETGLLILYWFSVIFKRFSKEINNYMHLLGKIKLKDTVFIESLPGTLLGAFTCDNSLTPHGLQSAFEDMTEQVQ